MGFSHTLISTETTWTGSVYSIINDGTQYYFVKNLQGDVVHIRSIYGTVVVEYTYDAWGNVLSITGMYADTLGVNNPIRYRGYYQDFETGFYYLQSRYYDPAIRRFINADSVLSQGTILGNNLFAYCLNNPVNLADETGNLPFFAITAAIGAVVGAVVGGVVAAKNGGNIWAGIGIGAATGALIGAGAGMATGAVLAGSITATTGAVVSGGSALISTVATGGVGAGATYIANNLQQAGTQISNAVTNTVRKVISKTPSNPGKPFEPGKTGFQYGVDPNTLTPQKNLATLDPKRMADAIKFAGDQSVQVSRTGVIQDGHHRVADAIMNGRAIDIFVEPYK